LTSWRGDRRPRLRVLRRDSRPRCRVTALVCVRITSTTTSWAPGRARASSAICGKRIPRSHPRSLNPPTTDSSDPMERVSPKGSRPGQTQIGRDPDLNESVSKSLVLVYRHEPPPSLVERQRVQSLSVGLPGERGTCPDV